jgi:hypothetical protein
MIAGRRMRRRLPLLALILAGAVGLFGALGFVTRGLSSVTQHIDAWTLRPRVLAGGDAFETINVTEAASTRQTGEFDGEPGDDLAIVEYDQLRLLTPATLAERGRLELGGDLRSRWKPSLRLARLGGTLVVVDTGGGLDETRVRDLDGTERWRYRPDTDVPATSLVPADLDADGNTEFYATITSHAVRLDADGQELWRAPFSVGRIVATAPRTRRHPAWIVAEGQGETVVWDSRGTRLASLTMKDARPLATVDWTDGRYVLAGGSAARAIALDGRVVFEWTVPGMTVSSARPLSLAAGTPPAVALVASGPGERNRWRLQIVSRDGVLLYDERLDTAPELLTARGADGVDRLFLDRASLLALRQRGSSWRLD